MCIRDRVLHNHGGEFGVSHSGNSVLPGRSDKNQFQPFPLRHRTPEIHLCGHKFVHVKITQFQMRRTACQQQHGSERLRHIPPGTLHALQGGQNRSLSGGRHAFRIPREILQYFHSAAQYGKRCAQLMADISCKCLFTGQIVAQFRLAAGKGPGKKSQFVFPVTQGRSGNKMCIRDSI